MKENEILQSLDRAGYGRLVPVNRSFHYCWKVPKDTVILKLSNSIFTAKNNL